MAKVEWSNGIDSVSGALSKPSKSGQHSCTKMLLGTHRVAATENPNGNRIYIRKGNTYGKKIAQTSEARAARTRFATVAQAVKARKENLTTLTQDQLAFKAQKDQPNGKKTFKAYLWKVCGDAYDEQYGG